MKNSRKIMSITLLGLFLCVCTANAYYTEVLSSGEPSLNEILTSEYQGLNLQRIEDDFDQLWMFPTASDGTFEIEAKYAGHTHNFGFYYESSPTLFQTLISGATPTSAATIGAGAGNIYFGLYDTNSGNYWSSHEIDNGPNNYDHMVTYQVLDDTDFHYVIAFEDLDLGDKDYNDLVIDVKMIQPTTPVPEPATMLLLGTGLIGLAGIGRKKFLIK